MRGCNKGVTFDVSKFIDMKVSEMERILTKDGWYIHRSGSNHDLYRHPTKEGQIPLSRHKGQELAKGTEQRILKDAGLK